MSSRVQRYTRSALFLSFLMLAMLAAACGRKEADEREADEAKPPATAEPAAVPALTDANIAAIVLTANQVDIENAKLALGKTKNAAVRAFANQMVTDHASVNRQVTDLATTLGMKPEDGDTSRQLEAHSDDTRETIEELKGAAFDRAYVDTEVALHQTVLDMLDQTLIPGATSAELKSLLESVRPAFVAHLDHAKHVQASLPR